MYLSAGRKSSHWLDDRHGQAYQQVVTDDQPTLVSPCLHPPFKPDCIGKSALYPPTFISFGYDWPVPDRLRNQTRKAMNAPTMSAKPRTTLKVLYWSGRSARFQLVNTIPTSVTPVTAHALRNVTRPRMTQSM